MDEQIEAMREEYLVSLPEKIETLEYLVMQIAKSGQESDQWEELLRSVHSIKGGAGSFGVGFVATACHALETILFESGRGRFDVDLCLQFTDMLSGYAREYLKNSHAVDEAAYAEMLRRLTPTREHHGFRVLVVENTKAMSDYYANTIREKYDITEIYARTGLEAFSRLLREGFDVLLTSMHVGELDGLSLIAALKVVRGPNRCIPTFLITSEVEKAGSITGFDADFVVKKSRSLHDELLGYFDDVFNRNFFVGVLPRRERRELTSVLCVDDDEMIHGLVRIGLARMTTLSRVECVGSGEAALARLKEFRPDLILMDVMMPGMGGPETLAGIRADKATASIPVIFLTGQQEKNEINALLELGVLGVIRKPFNNKKLAAYVETIWRRKC